MFVCPHLGSAHLGRPLSVNGWRQHPIDLYLGWTFTDRYRKGGGVLGLEVLIRRYMYVIIWI